MKNKVLLTIFILVLIVIKSQTVLAQDQQQRQVSKRISDIRANQIPLDQNPFLRDDNDPEVDDLNIDNNQDVENQIFLDPAEEFRRQEEQYRRGEIDYQRQEESFQRSERERKRSEVEYTFDQIERTFSFRESGEALNALAYKKVDKALYGFLNTDFMNKFRELKYNAENEVGRFKAMSNQLEPQQVARVQRAYAEIAHQFNRELEAIKRDFLDRKKMKMIQDNKEMYANSLRFRFRELQDDYSQNFLRILIETTGDDRYASATLAAIFGLIRFARDITNFFIEASYNARAVKEEHLNQFLIEPHRFRPWFEIEMIDAKMGFGDYDTGYDIQGEEEVDSNFDEMVPWEEHKTDNNPIDPTLN